MSDVPRFTMSDSTIRLQALKLATKVELTIFENRDDKRSEAKLKEDIRNTAAQFVEYISQNR